MIPLATTESAPGFPILFNGVPLAWAVLATACCAAASLWAYRRWAPTLSPRQRWILSILRILTLAVLFVLLTKPTLDITHMTPVREALIVLLDQSLSMTISDVRQTPEDVKRAGIAAGSLEPAKGLEQAPPGGNRPSITRANVLEAIRTNKKLNLWPRIAEKTDLIVYSFSREAEPVGTYTKDESDGADPADVVRLKDFAGETSAIGDALRTALDANRGRSLAGVFLLTDGASNAGLPPLEAALAAHADGLPIYAYGIGVTKPRDLAVRALDGPRIGFVNERVEYAATLHAGNLAGQTVNLVLSADGREVDKKKVVLSEVESVTETLGYVPIKGGDTEIRLTAEPVEGESNPDNNLLTTTLRVLADKIRILYIEGSPRWDFRYLLATLLLDHRLEVNAFLFNGDPSLDLLPDSPFLKELPASKDELFGYQIIIIGDVNPIHLGERMEFLEQWVGEVAGGLIFLAGPEFNPVAYAGTPLEALLPIELLSNPDLAKYRLRYPNLRPLRLTEAGEASRYFQADPDPLANRRFWTSFPGVRWTAAVGPAKPGAEVVAVDPDPTKSTAAGPAPVIAMQSYGAGQTIYFGTDETYRWRSRTGERLYIGFWGQIIQSLSLHRLSGASQLVQLRTDMPRYFVGEEVTISGRIYQKSFEPLTTASVPAKLASVEEEPASEKKERDLSLAMNPAKPGEYSVTFKVDEPGTYQFTSAQDPKAAVKFEVVEPRVELLDPAMNTELLQSLAAATNGKFLREEDLDGLPGLLSERTKTVASHEMIPLYESVWWLVVLVALLCAEWTLRRLWQLK